MMKLVKIIIGNMDQNSVQCGDEFEKGEAAWK